MFATICEPQRSSARPVRSRHFFRAVPSVHCSEIGTIIRSLGVNPTEAQLKKLLDDEV